MNRFGIPADSQTVTLLGQRCRVVDLSACLSNTTSAAEPLPHHIEYLDHNASIALSEQRLDLGAEAWRNGLAWAEERVTLSTHSGTHVDAPYHYAPMSGGAPARTIDELPFEWCMGAGVLLDMTGRDRIEGIHAEHVEAELDRIGHTLQPLDIVLVRTDASLHFGQPGYDQLHVGLRADAVRFLVDRGVRLVGIDAWGLDRPLALMVAEAKAGNAEQLWEAHYVGAETEYAQIERLTNLAALERPTGFSVLALPVKIDRASGAWARVVALVPDAVAG
jgi:kynurenine formamidase